MKKGGGFAAGMLFALLLVGAALFVVPEVKGRYDVLQTMQAAGEAYQARDCDALLDTINPVSAGKIRTALDSTDAAIDKGTNLLNQLIQGWNALAGEEYQLNTLEKKKLDRGMVLDIIAGTATPMMEANVQIDRSLLKLMQAVTVEGRQATLRVTASGTADGQAVTDDIVIRFQRDDNEKKWYIMSCTDDKGWLKGLNAVLNWE